MHLNWIHPNSGDHYSFLAVDLTHSHFNNLEGVYIIWHGGNNPHVVYVGQGEIGRRLSDHRNNTQILKYRGLDLYVTWAAVNGQHQDGVERYLANEWSPLVGDSWPDVTPIEINSPW